MAIKNRDTLKNYFQKGTIISEKQFIDLIDSSMNIIDNGIDVNPKDGLRLNPTGIFSKIISFFEKKSKKSADYSININHQNIEGLSLNNSSDETLLKINQDKIGVKTDEPAYDLHVNGALASNFRLGTYASGSIPANGKWHKIIENLDAINIFEIVATASGEINSGNYSALHAIALSTFGGSKSRSKIKVLTAYWNGFGFLGKIFSKRKIKIRWGGTLHNYYLEMKTSGDWEINRKTNKPYQLKFNITRLNI